MTAEEWTVKACCPHGHTVDLPFDALGYLTRPPDSACRHADPPPTPPPRGPGRLRTWLELRRARRALARIEDLFRGE